MTDQHPLITIITVVYNGARHLEQAIQSVVSQDYDNIEYIIIDGGSTDGTLDIIRRYGDHIAYWVSTPDNGIYDAMNKGLEKATGDFIGILNADDWYEPGIITQVAEQINHLEPDEDTPLDKFVIYCHYYRYDEELGSHAREKKYSTREFWTGMSICHQTMFVARELYEKLGPYDPIYDLAADYEYLLRMAQAGVNFVEINSHGVNFRMSGMSVRHVNRSIREASRVNRVYFGTFSKKHALFILANHIPALLANVKLVLYKVLGQEKTAALRRFRRRRLKRPVNGEKHC